MAIPGILTKILASIRGVPTPVTSVPIASGDLPVLLAPIVAFARGDQTQREAAVALHRELLSTRPDLRSHPAQMFMAEVDTPCPDLGLRADSRRRLAA